MKYGFFIRGQYRQGDDMVARFNELMEQARLADELGFSDLISGMHYAGYPLSQFQLLPFLSRIMGEAPNMRIITGIILLSLHKPLDIAEQLATMDVMSNGRLYSAPGSATARSSSVVSAPRRRTACPGWSKTSKRSSGCGRKSMST